MSAKITLLAEGEALDINETNKQLASLNDTDVETAETDRGMLTAALSVGKWIIEYAGDIGKLVDALIKIKESQPDGVKLKIKHGDLDVEIDNVHRDELINVLRELKELNMAADAL